MLSKNRLIIAGIVLAVALAFVWGFRTQPLSVDLATIKRGSLAVTINEEGVTRIREIYTVSAPVSGLLRRLSLKEGDRVQKGKTIVAVIEPIAPAFQDVRSMSVLRANVKSAEAALALAQAELSRVEADLDYAGAEFRRALKLYKKRIISRKIYDQAAAARRKAKASVSAARANVEVRRKELESIRARLIQPGRPVRKRKDKSGCCLSITAPASGRVLTLRHKSQQVVSAGTPLLEVGDDKDLEIVIDLLSSDAIKIRVGAKALITGWGGEHPLHARVRRIEPAGFTKVSALGIEEQRVRTLLDFSDDQQDRTRLGHDFRVFAHIRSWEGSNLVLVPLSALFRKGNDWAVFVMKDARAVLQKVRIDHRNGDYAEVIEGLKEGDRVIVHPSDKIHDGVAIAGRALAG